MKKKQSLFRKKTKKYDQGQYTDNKADQQNPIKKWICPDDETENTGAYCIICGNPAPESSPNSRTAVIVGCVVLCTLMIFLLGIFIGLSKNNWRKCSHKWMPADCFVPITCSKCGEVIGDALGHDYSDATCTKAETCIRCGKTSGLPLEHSWISATYDMPETCEYCGKVEGLPLGYPLSWCKKLEDSNPAGRNVEDVVVADWEDAVGTIYEDAIRFWVAKLKNWDRTEYIEYDLSGKYSYMEFSIAAEKNSDMNAEGKFLIYADDNLVYESEWIGYTQNAIQDSICVSGAEQIRIMCTTESAVFGYFILDACLYSSDILA